ncbi:hypothetical protein L211DRAFT_296682 [Terfezia boudieri ATCC MYA-4762]|uniref:Uncharacterized protein n=1 Tax=Terfezia boudieri ATCC MYA-4762 TaxID=1051890 RepID=A0A3N4LJM2_9PEZI|nr:hypothetical protein L211DRAFT_296682 [Terfezia boudieri ATCC MYA-4762]
MRMKLRRTHCTICPRTHTLLLRREWPQHRNGQYKLLLAADSSFRQSRKLGIISPQCHLLLVHRGNARGGRERT